MTNVLPLHMMKSAMPSSQLYDCKILIADDFNFCRVMLHDCFSSYGFKHIYEAVDGQDTIDKIDEIRPDLILLDMNMPHKSGLEVCAYIKQYHAIDDIVIIMQTGSDKDSLRSSAFEAGITDFVSKPLEAMEVMLRSVAHLERLLLKRNIQHQYEEIYHDLTQARAIQRILLPDASLLERICHDYKLDISFHFQPASELAGDYISVRALDDGRVALISADVSGHGIASALYAFTIHALLSNEFMEHQTAGDILCGLNKRLCMTEIYTMHATILLVIIDPKTRVMTYASAAAPPTILLSDGRPAILDTRGYLLGMDIDARFTTHELTLCSRDVLFICSDALYETPDLDGAFITEDDAYKLVKASQHESAKDMVESVTSYFGRYHQKLLSDDLSLLTCKLL
ncbi:MAG: fused response regulator/phosphatase [Sphaerospermopsis sp. SIO1G2]|nr:fused response regulator/phosphatase [Sphaerospermopsis sp. SIO1G2]